MDIRKKLFLVSKLLHPNGATHISDREQHLCPTLCISCAPASYLDLLPFPTGEVYASLRPRPLLQCLSPCRKESRGHNKDHGSRQDYWYLAAAQRHWGSPALTMYQGSPKSFTTAFSHGRMKHIRIKYIYGPQRHLISILGDVHRFERAALPGQHHCSHVPQPFVEFQWLVRIMKPPKTCPSSPCALHGLDLLHSTQNCSVWGRFAKIRQGETQSPALTPFKIPGNPHTVTGSRWTCSCCKHKVKEMVQLRRQRLSCTRSTYEPTFLVAFLCSYFQIIHYPKFSSPPSLKIIQK